jgi:hypothetical protein
LWQLLSELEQQDVTSGMFHAERGRLGAAQKQLEHFSHHEAHEGHEGRIKSYGFPFVFFVFFVVNVLFRCRREFVQVIHARTLSAAARKSGVGLRAWFKDGGRHLAANCTAP